MFIFFLKTLVILINKFKALQIADLIHFLPWKSRIHEKIENKVPSPRACKRDEDSGNILFSTEATNFFF